MTTSAGWRSPVPMKIDRVNHCSSGAEVSNVGTVLKYTEGGIDRLACEQLLGDLGRSMPDAGVLDVDEFSSLSLQHVARIEFGQAIGANDLPVRTTRHHLAAHIRSVERPAQDRNDAASSAWHVTELGRRTDLYAERHRQRQPGRSGSHWADGLRRLRRGQRYGHQKKDQRLHGTSARGEAAIMSNSLRRVNAANPSS